MNMACPRRGVALIGVLPAGGVKSLSLWNHDLLVIYWSISNEGLQRQ